MVQKEHGQQAASLAGIAQTQTAAAVDDIMQEGALTESPAPAQCRRCSQQQRPACSSTTHGCTSTAAINHHSIDLPGHCTRPHEKETLKAGGSGGGGAGKFFFHASDQPPLQLTHPPCRRMKLLLLSLSTTRNKILRVRCTRSSGSRYCRLPPCCTCWGQGRCPHPAD